jgi:hypothetical protein
VADPIMEVQVMSSFADVQMDAFEMMSTFLLLAASFWFGGRTGD